MPRRIYPNPPIVEAVIEFRFLSGMTREESIDILATALGEKYTGERKKQETLELSARIAAEGLETTTRQRLRSLFLQSSDGLRLLGCGNGFLSVHVLAPYPGWENFLDQARETISVLARQARSALAAVTVRYIDRILLPAGKPVSFSDYFTITPPRPVAMSHQLSGFHVVTETHDPENGTIALLRFASAAPDPQGHPVVIYDLTVQRLGDPVCGLDENEWVPIVERLHEQQRELFEASITDQMRERFQ